MNITDALDAQRVARLREIRAQAENLNSPDLIALAVRHCQSQADLARLSGLTTNTITAIKKGQPLNQSSRNAILWAIARSLGI